MGAVGGADLAQDGAGAGHDVGDAEGTADLDQLAAGDRDLLAQGQRIQHQQHGGGVVVDHGSGLGAGEVAEQGGDMVVALAAAAGGEVEFQRGGGAERRGGGLGGFWRQRGAAEIGVQHRAGEVEHWPLAGRELAGECVGGFVQDGGGRGREGAGGAPAGEGRAKGGGGGVPAEALGQEGRFGRTQQGVERRQWAGVIRHGGAS